MFTVCLLGGAATAAPFKGTVLHGKTLAPIKGATITVVSSGATARSNRGGAYRIPDAPVGPIEVRIEAKGFVTVTETIDVRADGTTEAVFVLLPPGAASEIIEVEDEAPDVTDAPGRQDLRREEITRIPGTRGDAITSIKSMPGVANADAAGAGPGLLVIRGAAPEDSRYSIDGIEIPLVYHFFGLQSFLPSEFIETIEFLPGGFGVQEGRATGGIINIVTRSDEIKKLEGFTELSFINFAGFIQGPLSKKHNLQFAAGLRRSTIDLILPAVIPEDANISFSTAPQYYDGQLRVDWRPKPQHRLTVLGLMSFDLLTLINDNIDPNEPLLNNATFENETSFTRLITTWKYSGDELESRLSGSVGTTGLRFQIGSDRFLDASVVRTEVRHDLRWSPVKNVRVKVGGEGRLANGHFKVKLPLPPQEGSGNVPNFSSSAVVERDEKITNHIAAAYAMVDIMPISGTTITPGVRVDYFDRFSATTVLPRVALSQRITDRFKLRASMGAYSRPLTQAEALPTYLKPELATQYVAGGDYNIGEGLQAAFSGFYTDRRQLVVQDPMAAELDPQNAYVNRGYGRSYGAEALVRAKRDNFFGWVSYTISRSDRVDGPENDRRLFDFDQTHNIILVGSYKWGKWEFGGRWQYSTGNPVTPVVGSIYLSDLNIYLPRLGEINGDRIDAAHQFDLRIDRRWEFNNWKLSAYLDVTNVYANPRTLGFTYNYDYSERQAIEELPIVPAFGLRGSF